MRTNKITAVFFALFIGLSSSAFAQVQFFDFSGWDDSLIQGGGQTFTDIVGNVDVTVTSIGSFTSTSGIGTNISTDHATPNSASLRFVFSEPLDLVVSTKTVDADEVQSIFAIGPETYTNQSGAAPVVTPVGSGISIAGTSFGISPTGASFGETTTGPSQLLTLTYEALSTDKFGDWMIGGTVVPEPNSIALLGIGGLGMLMEFRRKRRA